jgi:hypothetical protein
MALLPLLSSAIIATFKAGLCLFAAGVVALLAKYIIRSRRPRNFPPGPTTITLLGNISDLPSRKAFLKYVLITVLSLSLPLTICRFHELTKEYGSIVGLKLGPQNVVVLNGYKHVRA